jgi:C1A family cysteine protease
LGLRIPQYRQPEEDLIDKKNKYRLFKLKSQDKSLKIPLFDRLEDGVTVPDYVNWYEAGKVTRPYNQKNCGSCWAFTAVATLEALAAITGHDQTVQEYSV